MIDLKLAEIIGIALGDGSIPRNKSRIRITLNKSEEPQYTRKVYKLLFDVLGKKPTIYEPKDANAIKLTVSGKTIVEKLIKKGLQPGDKKVNQVKVPDWIKMNNNFVKNCLRGLTDTDGSIHVHKSYKRIRVGFKNASKPLMKDFKEMCEILNIQTGSIFPSKGQDTYQLHIESKKQVVKFINKVEPRKWAYRAETIGLVLISIKESRKWRKVKTELLKQYPYGKVHYDKDYKNYIKYLCKKNCYDISSEAIKLELLYALTYRDNCKGISKKIIEENNQLAKTIINKLKF
ncbi:MAG: LAGLIDADG family homing endonuclease [Promethearchaeati archaeon]